MGTHRIHDTDETPPLDGFGIVRTDVSVRVRDTVVTGSVCAGWAKLELRVVAPDHLAGLRYKRDRAGFAAAMQAKVDPASRFTYGGELAARGLHLVQEVLQQAVHDHEIVAGNAEQVGLRVIEAERGLRWCDEERRKLADPTARTALKRCYRRGTLSQREYQGLVRQLKDHRIGRETELGRAWATAHEDMAEGLAGHPVSFEDALLHLRDPRVREQLTEPTREQIDAILDERRHE